MKIIHIADLGRPNKKHGITTVVENLSKFQQKLGHDVYIFQIVPDKRDDDLDCVRIVPSLQVFKQLVLKIHPDIVVFHSIYHWCYIPFSSFLNKKNIPYLVEVHGGVSKLTQSKSKWQKKIANFLFFNKFVEKSKGIIYLNKKEYEDAAVFRELFPAIIIPNGCELPLFKREKLNAGVMHFLYMSRIDLYHKGLDLLIEAIGSIYEKVRGKIIIDFYGYMYDSTFSEMIKPYSDVLKYHGAVYGEEKDAVMRSSDVFILTSRSEGMPMSVMEAMSFGLPCMITPQTNMAEIVGQTGWIVDCDASAIAQKIIEILNTPKDVLLKMGQNAQNAVKPYSWNEIAKLSIKEYNIICSKKNNDNKI